VLIAFVCSWNEGVNPGFSFCVFWIQSLVFFEMIRFEEEESSSWLLLWSSYRGVRESSSRVPVKSCGKKYQKTKDR